MEHRVSDTQLEELLDYLLMHPNLANGVGLGTRSREAANQQWEDIASRLNSHENGASKNGQRWKRYWADLKFKVKMRKKAVKQRQENGDVSSGPTSLEDMSEYDKKVLAIIQASSRNGGNGESSLYSSNARTPSPSSDHSETPCKDEKIYRRRPRSAIRVRTLGSETCDVDIKKKSFDSKQRMADALSEMSKAVRMNAETARMNAETARMNAETARTFAEVMRMQAEAISFVFKE